MYVDGYEIAVTPGTQVQLPNALDSGRFNPNLQVWYRAARQSSSALQATQMSFIEDDEIPEEQKYREKSAFKIVLPDYDKKIPGKVQIVFKDYEVLPYFKKTFEVIPNRDMQKMVDVLGQKLVPDWQRELPDSDPAKIQFHFYVVKSTKLLSAPLSDGAGNILIPSQILTRLQNEAQLACLLSAHIAAAVEKDFYRSRMYRHSQAALDAALIPVPFGFAGQMIANGAFAGNYWTPLNSASPVRRREKSSCV